MTAALIKRGNLDTKNAQGTHHVKMKGEMGDVSTSQGMPNITSKSPEARAWTRFSLTAQREPALLMPSSGLQTGRQYISVVQTVQASNFVITAPGN